MPLRSRTSPKPIQVLLVDDDETILETTAALLESDFEVRTATSGARALRLMENGPADCVCTDFNMPEMNGVELIEAVADRYPHAMGVLITGFREQLPVGARRSEHIFGIVYKPYRADQLAQIVRDAVRTKRMSSAVASFARNSTRLGSK